jgi:transposase
MPSDLTDEEWTGVEPVIPPAKVGGNRRRVDAREVVNGIMSVLSTGCQWLALPKDLPPRSTVFDYLDLWSLDGTLDRMHHALYAECRKRGERQASPTAAIVDSQSLKSAEKSRARRVVDPFTASLPCSPSVSSAHDATAVPIESIAPPCRDPLPSNGPAR